MSTNEGKEKKKFYIAVDCEGCSCVVGRSSDCLPSTGTQYEFACKQATKEANAAATALFEMGATEVWVWDNHSAGTNLDYELLDERCKIVLGTGHKGRFPNIDESFGGVLFIGYHSRDNVVNAVLSHTYSSNTYQYIKINGEEVGELEIDAAFAGESGVPVMFISGDDKLIRQAKLAFPHAKTVETKKSLSWNSAISIHPSMACKQINEQVKIAYRRLSEQRPYKFTPPLAIEMRFRTIEGSQNAQLVDQYGSPFSYIDAFSRRGTIRSIDKLF